MKRLEILYEEQVDLIVLDTAHGHSENVIKMLKDIKENFPKLDVPV